MAALLDQITAHRLTIVQAGPGYGKSTAVALHLCSSSHQFFWYSTSGTDADPHVFMSHLVWSMRSAYPRMGGSALAIISQGLDATARRRAVEALANDMLDMLQADAVLVIDDYHAASRNPEIHDIVEFLVDTMPPQMHLVLCTRKRPALSAIPRWRVKGDVLEITERDLAFTGDEIRDLFATAYQLELTQAQVRLMAERTEGWIIAVEMIWHALREGLSLDELLSRSPATLDSVFDYLVQEVLLKQKESVGAFLIDVSVLDELTPQPAPPSRQRPRRTFPPLLSSPSAACSSTPRPAPIGSTTSSSLPRHLYRRDFDRWALARRAASFYADRGDAVHAVDHLWADDRHRRQPPPLRRPELIASGRVDNLAHLVDQLQAPPGSLPISWSTPTLPGDYQNAWPGNRRPGSRRPRRNASHSRAQGQSLRLPRHRGAAKSDALWPGPGSPPRRRPPRARHASPHDGRARPARARAKKP